MPRVSIPILRENERLLKERVRESRREKWKADLAIIREVGGLSRQQSRVKSRPLWLDKDTSLTEILERVP
jgi:hypothetical protein